MSKDVRLPDGTVGRFPDDMPDSAIADVLKKQFPPTAAPTAKASDFGDTSAGVLTQALGGAKHAWDRAAMGLKGVFTDLSPEDKQLLESGKKFVDETGPASSLGEFGGEVLLTAAPSTRAVQLANRTRSIAPTVFPRLRNILVPGAAAGAAGAATMGDDPVQGAAVGAALGPVFQAGGRLLDYGVRGVQNITGGAAGRAVKEMQDVFGERLPQAIAALRALTPQLAGDMPTAGHAASPMLPEFKAIQENALRSPGSHRIRTRLDATQQAREDALDTMAHPGQRYFDPQTRTTGLSEAEAAREAAAGPLMARARNERVGVTPEVEALLAGPEAASALRAGTGSFRQGQLNAEGRGASFPGGREPPTPSPNPRPDFFPEGGEAPMPAMPAEPFMPQPANYSIDELWRVRQNIDEQLARLHRSTDTTAPGQIRQLNDARRQLTQAMEQSGNFRMSNTVYRNMSAPQNQADVAAELRRQLISPTGADRLSSFLGAIENAPRTIQRADLSPRFQNIGEVMTPDQMGTINNITSTLRREADYRNLGSTGGNAPGQAGTLEKIEMALPPVFSKEITTLRKALRLLGTHSDEQVKEIINEAIADPARMERLLSSTAPENRNRVINSIRRIASAEATLPTAVGTMTAQEGAQ